MLNDDVLSLLGLASRARKITCGDILLKDIRNNQVSFVLIAEDASDNTKKKYSDKCQFYKVDYLIIGNVDDLSKAIGKSNRVVIGIKDRGFASKIKSKLGG
ncbi:MAG: ribosomal L7Ae/L30e/S12e/Gadd45 family protein [Coprobacillus sp.]